MSAAWHRGWRKAVRTGLQLVAAGALTAAVNTFADGLSPNVKVYVLAGWTVAVALAQNALETNGKIPALLPTPGLVPSVGAAGRAVGVVETTIDKAGDAVGDIEGIVEDTAGGLLGVVRPADEDEEE
jgi:hypothetical protein